MKVEIVIEDQRSVGATNHATARKHTLKEMARITLPTSSEDSATDLINFAESGFEMSAAPQPASNYHAGLRQMFQGIWSAYIFHGEITITAKVVE